jgi:hypothetical protein
MLSPWCSLSFCQSNDLHGSTSSGFDARELLALDIVATAYFTGHSHIVRSLSLWFLSPAQS